LNSQLATVVVEEYAATLDVSEYLVKVEAFRLNLPNRLRTVSEPSGTH